MFQKEFRHHFIAFTLSIQGIEHAADPSLPSSILEDESNAQVLRSYGRGYDVKVGKADLVAGDLVGRFRKVLDKAVDIAQRLESHLFEYTQIR